MSMNRTRLALNGPDKYRLCQWAEQNLDRVMARTLQEAASLATAELSMDLTAHNIRGALTAIGAPSRKPKADPTSKAAMVARMEHLEERNQILTDTFIDMCSQLNINTNDPAWQQLKQPLQS